MLENSSLTDCNKMAIQIFFLAIKYEYVKMSCSQTPEFRARRMKPWAGCGLQNKSVKIQSHSFLPVSHSWGTASYLHSSSQPIVCQDQLELATFGQLELSRDENPRSGPAGNSPMCSPAGRERDGRGPVFGAVLEVWDVYHVRCLPTAVDIWGRGQIEALLSAVWWTLNLVTYCNWKLPSVYVTGFESNCNFVQLPEVCGCGGCWGGGDE